MIFFIEIAGEIYLNHGFHWKHFILVPLIIYFYTKIIVGMSLEDKPKSEEEVHEIEINEN